MPYYNILVTDNYISTVTLYLSHTTLHLLSISTHLTYTLLLHITSLIPLLIYFHFLHFTHFTFTLLSHFTHTPHHSVTYTITFTLVSHLSQYISLFSLHTFYLNSLLTHNSNLTLSYYFIYFQFTVTLPY